MCCNPVGMPDNIHLHMQEGVVYFKDVGASSGVYFPVNLFGDFLSDPAYFERFSFFNKAGGWRLTGKARQEAERLFEELTELYTTKGWHGTAGRERGGSPDSSADLIKVLLLQLFFVIEEAYLTSR